MDEVSFGATALEGQTVVIDAAYVNGCEDIDLCLKLAAKGRQSWVATASRIRHHVSLSRSRTSANGPR